MIQNWGNSSTSVTDTLQGNPIPLCGDGEVLEYTVDSLVCVALTEASGHPGMFSDPLIFSLLALLIFIGANLLVAYCIIIPALARDNVKALGAIQRLREFGENIKRQHYKHDHCSKHGNFGECINPTCILACSILKETEQYEVK